MARALKYDASGNAINKYGVKITAEQQRIIKNLSQTVNRRRDQLIKQEKKRLKEFEESTGYEIPYTESLFIMNKKSRSLQRFQSKAEVQKYISELKKKAKPSFVRQATIEYRKNYLKAMEENMGDDLPEEYYNKIKKMSLEQFRMFVQVEKLETISYFYTEQDRKEKVEKVKTMIDEL